MTTVWLQQLWNISKHYKHRYSKTTIYNTTLSTYTHSLIHSHMLFFFLTSIGYLLESTVCSEPLECSSVFPQWKWNCMVEYLWLRPPPAISTIFSSNTHFTEREQEIENYFFNLCVLLLFIINNYVYVLYELVHWVGCFTIFYSFEVAILRSEHLILILVHCNNTKLWRNTGLATCVASVGKILHAAWIWEIGEGEAVKALVVDRFFVVNVDRWLSFSPTLRIWKHMPVRGAVIW